ncbi:MAG: hypothetical protein HQL65_20455 [Magnetococcales bacterium]|nr:hypothetical protein [Magnetococcales bacterium]
MNRYSILARFKEPSTWAALAALLAIITGHDPTLVADNTTKIVGCVISLLGIVLPETKNLNQPKI